MHTISEIICKIGFTLMFPIIALLDWTISDYPLRDIWRQNIKHYLEIVK